MNGKDNFIRLKPEVSPGYDVDRTKLLRAEKKEKMYPLLIRAPYGYAGELVLDANPAALKTLPNADAMAFGFGGLFFLTLGCTGLGLFFFGDFLGSWARYRTTLELSALFSAFIPAVMSLLAVAAIVGFLRVILTKEFARPTIFNRRTGTVIQMQGAKRVEARWKDLQPYIEEIRIVHAAGGSAVDNFHLVEPAEGGRTARNLIEVKLHAGGTDVAAMYYRFLSDYMDGKWEDLPEIYLLGGIRLPLWREFRQHRLSFWFATRDWADRSRENKLWMSLLIPLWTAGWWPMYIFSFIGGRMGWVPQLSEEDLSGTDWEESKDGPVPAALADKIRARTLHPDEKRLYIVSFVLGLFLWIWLSIWLFQNMILWLFGFE